MLMSQRTSGSVRGLMTRGNRCAPGASRIVTRLCDRCPAGLRARAPLPAAREGEPGAACLVPDCTDFRNWLNTNRSHGGRLLSSVKSQLNMEARAVALWRTLARVGVEWHATRTRFPRLLCS